MGTYCAISAIVPLASLLVLHAYGPWSIAIIRNLLEEFTTCRYTLMFWSSRFPQNTFSACELVETAEAKFSWKIWHGGQRSPGLGEGGELPRVLVFVEGRASRHLVRRLHRDEVVYDELPARHEVDRACAVIVKRNAATAADTHRNHATSGKCPSTTERGL